MSWEGFRPATIWALLVLLTMASLGTTERLHLGVAADLMIAALAGIKGLLVMGRFMELGHARRFWRHAYAVWLVAVTLILMALGGAG